MVRSGNGDPQIQWEGDVVGAASREAKCRVKNTLIRKLKSGRGSAISASQKAQTLLGDFSRPSAAQCVLGILPYMHAFLFL